tara:strand:- start:12370 stop:13128 length:759 start_codon:yes stop_codon:yes gene_type:complete
MRPRIIPILLINEGQLVKSIRFKNENYIGDPLNAVKVFNEKNADELVILDISATKNKRGPDFQLIENLANECFMPLTYGGGITNIEEVSKIFSIGVEKISINNSLINNKISICDLVNKFGSQSIVASIDIKKSFFGQFRLHNYYGFSLRYNLKEYLNMIISSGVGEILLTSVDNDGMQLGLDLKLIKEITSLVSVPVVACGGVGSIDDISKGIHNSGASGIGVGSMFVYSGPLKGVLISYLSNEEIENLAKQ